MGSLSESSGAEDPVARWLAEADAAEREGRESPPPPAGLEDEAAELRMCLSMLAKVWPEQEDTPVGSTHVDRPVVDQTLLPSKLGEFEILRILGRGGFGVVCLANDPRIPRLVAIKLPRPEWMASASVQRRFRLEAKLAGGMQHAHIVPVFESGQMGSFLYLVSEYCPGPNLALWIGERKKAGRNIDPAGIREAATVVAQLADGLAHAHERGVLHRDLKPANILLQPIGPDVPADAPLSRYVPKLTDFGLAKLMEQGAGETLSGAAIGTPSFMAPEQAKGDLDAIDPRTDVYGLGAVLYQLLTGVPPFRNVFEVLNAELTPPSRLCKSVPTDLEAICRKCLEKDQSQRYPTARALREDLERFLQDRPTQARPLSRPRRVARWVKKRPMLAGLSGLLILAMLTLMGGGLWFFARLTQADEKVATARYYEIINAVEKKLARPHLDWRAGALADLEEASRLPTPKRNEAELRTLFASCLGGVDLKKRKEVPLEWELGTIAYHPNGKWLALGDLWRKDKTDLRVYLLDAKSGKKLKTFHLEHDSKWGEAAGTADGICGFEFSPDGRCLVALTRSGIAHRLDMNDWNQQDVAARGFGEWTREFKFWPDGKTLYAVSERENILRRWDTAGAKWTRIEDPAAPQCRQFALLPALDKIATGWDAVYLYDRSLTNGKRSDDRTSWVMAMPDGKTVLAHAGDLAFLVDPERNVITGSFRAPMRETSGHPKGLVRLLPSPDGRLMLSSSGGDSPSHYLWEVAGGKLLVKLVLNGGTTAAAFAPDGRTLAIIGEKCVHLYDLAGQHEQSIAALQCHPVNDFILGQDGASLTTIDGCKRVQRSWHRWSMTESMVSPTAGIRMDRFFGNYFLPTSSGEGYALANDRELQTTDGFQSKENNLSVPIWKAVLDGKGRTWGAHHEFVFLLNGATNEYAGKWANHPPPEQSGQNNIRSLAVGENYVVVGCRSGHFAVLDPRDVSEISYQALTDLPLDSVALAPSETVAAAGDSFGTLRIIDVPSGKARLTRKIHSDTIEEIVFLDERFLVTGASDGDVKIFQLEGDDLTELITLRMGGSVKRLAVTPDKRRLAVLLQNERGVRLWHLDRLEQAFGPLHLSMKLPLCDPPKQAAPGKGGFLREIFPVKSREKALDAQVFLPPERPAPPLVKQPHNTTHRWSAWVKPLRPGKHSLLVQTRGGVSLWWNNNPLVDEWALSEFDRAIELDVAHHAQPLRIEVTGVGFTPELKLFWKHHEEQHYRPLTEYEASPTPHAMPFSAEGYAAALARESWRSLLNGWTLEEAAKNLKVLSVRDDHPCRHVLENEENRTQLQDLQSRIELELPVEPR